MNQQPNFTINLPSPFQGMPYQLIQQQQILDYQQFVPLKFNKEEKLNETNVEEFEVYCPKHQERVIQVQINEADEIKTECQKCLTQKEYKFSVQELSQKITAHRSNELQILNTLSEQVLTSLSDLKKNVEDIIECITQKMNNLITEIENQQQRLRELTKKESDILTKSISQLQLADLQKLTREVTFNISSQNLFDQELQSFYYNASQVYNDAICQFQNSQFFRDQQYQQQCMNYFNPAYTGQQFIPIMNQNAQFLQ